MAQQQEGLSRRGFIATAALGAGSIAVLSGCTPSGSNNASGGDGDSNTEATGASNDLNPQEDYTADTTDFSAVFQPMQLGSLTLKNRIVKSPGGSDTWAPEGDSLNDDFLDYYENFAKGGAAAVFTESSIRDYIGMDIAKHEQTGWFGANLSKAKDLLGPVVERVHEHDAFIGFQLAGPGSVGGLDITSLTLDDIKWAQQAMVDTALAYKEAGYDICQLHCAAQQMLNTMMSPRGNERTDQYAADTVENRTRFTCELIKMIKDACGQDYPIQILMNAVEENDREIGQSDGFLSLMDNIENAKMFEAAGADTLYLRTNVPGLHISQFAPDLFFTGYRCEGLTGYGPRFDFSQHFGGALTSQYSGCGLLLDACAEFKKHVGIPVSCAGYMDPRTAPDLMNNAIADGSIDYFMMTRPLTVDTELPNKLQAGKRDEIAPCTRCMHCHCKGGPNGEVGDEWCRVNAMTQNAYPNKNARIKDGLPGHYELIPASATKKILVVGGGPAGMEAARIAALRGHDVTLYEKDDSLGGLMRTAHAYKGDHERLGDLIAYLSRQQEVAGVKVNTGTEVDADLIKGENPDTVVIATGGRRVSNLSAGGSVQVIGFEEAASADLGEKVIVLGAGAQAVDLTLYLLAQGKKVQMIHGGKRAEIDKEQSMWVRSYVIPYLNYCGVKIWNESAALLADNEGLVIENQFGTSFTLECDTVIECYDMVPNTELFDSVKDSFETVAVGDCDNPWNIADAIIFANRAGRII